MQGNFKYHNPTKLYFGEESLNYLKKELNNYGPVVLLNYGSGSVKRNGIYDQVMAILREAGKTVIENPGVMSNPTLEKLDEGVRIARENHIDLILSLGGGSVCDYSKAVAASTYFEGTTGNTSGCKDINRLQISALSLWVVSLRWQEPVAR